MRRLADGVYAVICNPPLDSNVQSIRNPRVVNVPPEERDELVRLAHGERDDTDAGPAYERLARAGFADDGLPAEDRAIVERLSELGRGWAWHVRGAPGADELVALLRRLHSRRKLSLFELGQTACLPESGVARCWELTRRIGERKRVLCIGDDDLLSLALAKMGHKVTVIDIDPVLIDFLRRCADAEGLTADIRVQDVLQPMPADLVGKFDVVLTDPMSFESCLVAFLSRAVSAVKAGGAIFSCLHPLARGIFQRVVEQLPVDVTDVLYELSTYYYQGFVENWYRSDLYMLRRVQGEPRFAFDDVIPFRDIIAGKLEERLHGFTDVKGHPFQRIDWATVRRVVEGWAANLEGQVLDRYVREDERWAHLYLAMSEGGHLALTFDKQKCNTAWDLYPFTEKLDASLVTAFAAEVPLARAIEFHSNAPDLSIPSVKAPPPPRDALRPRPAARKRVSTTEKRAAKKTARKRR